MNNSISRSLNEKITNVGTGLNICFIMPIEEPEKFKIEKNST